MTGICQNGVVSNVNNTAVTFFFPCDRYCFVDYCCGHEAVTIQYLLTRRPVLYRRLSSVLEDVLSVGE